VDQPPSAPTLRPSVPRERSNASNPTPVSCLVNAQSTTDRTRARRQTSSSGSYYMNSIRLDVEYNTRDSSGARRDRRLLRPWSRPCPRRTSRPVLLKWVHKTSEIPAPLCQRLCASAFVPAPLCQRLCASAFVPAPLCQRLCASAFEPVPAHLVTESLHRIGVARHGVGSDMSSHHAAEPSSLLGGSGGADGA